MAESERTIQPVTVDGRALKLSNLDKVLYPATETTKGEVLHYYTQVSSRILTQLSDRVVTRVRFPHGVGDLQFFEKNTPSGAPSWIERRQVGSVDFPLVSDTAALVYFANLSSLEFHTPQWKLPGSEGETVDRIVFDLDPGAPAGLVECATVALIVRDLCTSLGWPCVPVTSGSKGMQIYARPSETMGSDRARELAKSIADKLEELMGDLVVSRMTKSLRAGKIFLDWSQNSGSKTTVTPWSLRGRQAPYVALPRTWEEISRATESAGTLTQLDYDTVLSERLSEPDPMDELTR